MPTVTWNPLAQQVAEADTVYLMDLAVEATFAPGTGGLLAGDQFDEPPWRAGNHRTAEVTGRFRNGIHCTSRSGGGWLWMPGTGLLPSTEFTWECFLKCDVAWSAAWDQFPVGFAECEDRGFALWIHQGQLWVIFHHNQGPTGEVNASFAYNTTFGAGTWVSVAVTYLNSTLRLYVDGVERGSTSAPPPRVWGDRSRAEGLNIGGWAARGTGAEQFAVSDLRISRRARVPGVPLVVDDFNVVTVDPNSVIGTIKPKLRGGLHTQMPGGTGSTVGGHPAENALLTPRALDSIRTDKMLTATPIKAGGTDGTHPTAGISGAYSYNWAVVDRTFDWINSFGATPFISIDAAPQILGGQVAPFTAGGNPDLNQHHSAWAGQSVVPPNNFTEWNKIVRDFVNHVTVTKGYPVTYFSVWNEPDGQGFWTGTFAQYLQLYDATHDAIKQVNAALKVGGPEVEHLSATWVEGLIAHCAQAGKALDFVSWHYYTGDVGEIKSIRQLVTKWAAQYGIANPELICGEWNWQLANGPNPPPSGSPPWNALDYFRNDWAAAFAAASLIEFQHIGAVYSIYTNPVSHSNGGFLAGGLVSGTDGHTWANVNVYRQWGKLKTSVVAHTYTGHPGVFCVATRDTGGALAVMVVNLRYRKGTNLTVDVQLPASLSGQAVTHHVVNDQLSNYLDAGSGHQALETVSQPNVPVDGKVTITMRPRSVSLLEIGGTLPPPDTTPPNTTITSAPSDGSTGSVSFVFTSSESPATFEVRIDNGSWNSATSPKTYSGLATGSHTFEVRAIDAAGNVDLTPASHTWTVASTPPPGGQPYPDTILATANLLAYYRLGETSGTNANDSSPANLDGTYSGPTLNQSGAITGDSDKAAAFEDDVVELPAGLSLTAGSAITVEWWQYVATADLREGAAFTIGDQMDPNRCQSQAPWGDGTLYWDYGSYPAGNVNYSYAGFFDKWTHVALTFDPATNVHAIYLDGALRNSKVDANKTTGTISGGRIGGWPAAARYTKAKLDEFAVYSRALSLAEITAHYDAGISGTGPPPPGGGVLTNPINPLHLTPRADWAKKSHWNQPWRAYMETRAGATLRDAVGINWKATSARTSANAQLLAASGFKAARLEVGWGQINYDNRNAIDDVAVLRSRLLAMQTNGIRPLILLNSNGGRPCPTKDISVVLTADAAAGATQITVNQATAGLVTSNARRIGISGQYFPADQYSAGVAAAVLMMSIGGGNVVQLSRPLPNALTAGTVYNGHVLGFEPFHPPLMLDGFTPNPIWEATVTGWLDYIRVVTSEVKTTLGNSNFDLEIWNEMFFGADFLWANVYYNPPEPGIGDIGAKQRELIRRSVNWIRDPANGIANVPVTNGLASEIPWIASSESPNGLTALSKHPYAGAARQYPAAHSHDGNPPIDALGNIDSDGLVGGSYPARFVPTYRAFFPEHFLTAIQPEHYIRDMAPITTQIGATLHGRNAGPAGSRVGTWITEHNTISIGIDTQDAHDQAKACLRELFAYVSLGCDRFYYYADDHEGLSLVPAAFYAAVDAGGGAYPGTGTGGETMDVLRRVGAAFASSTSIPSPRQLTLDRIEDFEDRAQFQGDGTAAHPHLFNRDVLAVFPFQTAANVFKVAVYVMTRDVQADFGADQTFRVTLGNVNGADATLAGTDPMTGSSVTVTKISSTASTLEFEMAVSDTPRIVTITEPVGDPDPPPPTADRRRGIANAKTTATIQHHKTTAAITAHKTQAVITNHLKGA